MSNQTTARKTSQFPMTRTIGHADVFSVFTPRNDRVESELVVVDAGRPSRYELESRHPGSETISLSLNAMQRDLEEWKKLPVIKCKPTWFKAGGNHYCINVYAKFKDAPYFLADRVVVQARDFATAHRCAASKTALEGLNHVNRVFINRGTIEHYEQAVTQMHQIVEGSLTDFTDLRTTEPLDSAIHQWRSSKAANSLWGRSYGNWDFDLSVFVSLGFDLSVDSPQRDLLIKKVKEDVAYNKSCLEMANNESYDQNLRSSFRAGAPTNIKESTDVLNYLLSFKGA